MPTTTFDTGDVLELVELLGFLRDWLRADPARLADSLTRFVGTPGYNLDDLVTDLDRFRFLLGGDAEDDLFGTHDPQR